MTQNSTTKPNKLERKKVGRKRRAEERKARKDKSSPLPVPGQAAGERERGQVQALTARIIGLLTALWAPVQKAGRWADTGREEADAIHEAFRSLLTTLERVPDSERVASFTRKVQRQVNEVLALAERGIPVEEAHTNGDEEAAGRQAARAAALRQAEAAITAVGAIWERVNGAAKKRLATVTRRATDKMRARKRPSRSNGGASAVHDQEDEEVPDDQK
jgi:hypothetical protein